MAGPARMICVPNPRMCMATIDYLDKSAELLTVVGGTPLLPVYAGEIQTACLGMAVNIFDTTRTEPVPVTTEPGELVCTLPFPSQPLRFYGPQGNEKYRSSYFERFGNSIWCQGDFIKINPETRGIEMLGRSSVLCSWLEPQIFSLSI